MRIIIFAFIGLLAWGPVAYAEEQVDRLSKALHLQDVIAILRDEGVSQGREIDAELLDGKGGGLFYAQVEDIFDPVQMHSDLSSALGKHLTKAQLEQAAIFFESELGQVIISLENSARKAMTDDAIEEMANATYEEIDKNSSYFALVDEYIQVNDLIEQNVQSSISADFNFIRGIADGQGSTSDDRALLAQLLEQRDTTAENTKTWMYSYLLLAYQPLNEAQMRENIAFSRTDTGRALNRALFDGFDNVYDGISYQLGLAVADAMQASDL